jgi:ATP-binding cassette, subfamily B, bacterial MsbA
MFRRFRPYYGYLKPVRWHFIGALFCAAVVGVSSGYGVPKLIDEIFRPFFESAGEKRASASDLIPILALIPLVFGIRAGAQFLNGYLSTYCGTRVLESLRTDFFAKLQRLPLAFFQRERTGDILARGVSDTQQVQHTLISTANDLMVQPITLIGAIGYTVYLAATRPGASGILLALALIPLCVLPIRVIGKKLYRRAQQAVAASGDVSERLRENLSAAREVRAFSLESREISRFQDAIRKLFGAQLKVAKYTFMLSPLIEFLTAFGIGGALYAAYVSNTPWNSVVAMLAALYFSYDPLKKLGRVQGELTRGAAALDRIEAILNEPEVITDAPSAHEPKKVEGEIEFRDVTFSYQSAEKSLAALRHVNVRIPAGTVCALVGPSRAGKTSFANLVPRFYDTTSGSVLIDGQDVRSLSLKTLRSNIAIVSQDPVLFNDTIFNNILLARPTATKAEVHEAARAAFAHDFIVSLPEQYDTAVGERGTRLSGGQKQRVALARAFLRNAPILILDEATSALDSESERFIQEALQKLVVGKTVLIIAHRFSTIRDASLILVFDQGEIVARGSHAEIYETSTRYRALYDTQSATH